MRFWGLGGACARPTRPVEDAGPYPKPPGPTARPMDRASSPRCVGAVGFLGRTRGNYGAHRWSFAYRR